MALKNSKPSQLHDSIGYDKEILPADGVSIVDIFTVVAGQDCEIHIYSVMLQSTDGASNNVSLYIHNGTRYFLIGTRTVAAGGDLEVIANTSTPLKRMYKDLRGNFFIKLKAGEKLAAKVGTALAVGENLCIDVDGWNFKATT